VSDALSTEIYKYITRLEESVAGCVEAIKKIPDHNLEALMEIQRNLESLKEESKSCNDDDLPAIIQQMHLQNQLAERFSTHVSLPDSESPFFGHMRIKQEGKIKDIYLGHISFSHRLAKFKIIDWKKAPIARVFYQFAEEDDFELDLEERTIEGTILEKSILTIRNGELLRVDRGGESFVKRDGNWMSMHEEAAVLAGGEGKANGELAFGMGNTNFDSPEVISLLDKIQYDIVHGDAKKPLLITGGAGSGKTTVALYRIAKLCEKGILNPNDALVLVPNAGLINLSKTLLYNIGLERVHVKTTEDLIKEVVTTTIKGMPRKINDNTPLGVSTIKRHPYTLEILKEYVEQQKELAFSVLEKMQNKDRIFNFIASNKHLSIIPLMKLIHEQPYITSLERIQIKEQLRKLRNYQEDIFNLFTNFNLVEKLKDQSNGFITSRMLEELKFHMSSTYNEFDSDKDHQSSEARMDRSGMFDFEDYPLLLKLVELKNGTVHINNHKIKMYKHIFLDEAQELSASELELLSQTLMNDGNYTVAGDAIQQIDPSMVFTSWDLVLKSLGISDFKASQLNVSYRSPKQIVEFAHTVLGPLAPGQMPDTKRNGGPVIKTQVQHLAHASMVLSDALVDLTKREPRATIAIICNREETAEQFYNELADIGGVNLVLDQGFNFKPGIDITTVDQIRGLEFDYVILPDTDRVNYPENNRSRKRLHLAATRAIHQLWVLFPLDRTILF